MLAEDLIRWETQLLALLFAAGLRAPRLRIRPLQPPPKYFPKNPSSALSNANLSADRDK